MGPLSDIANRTVDFVEGVELVGFCRGYPLCLSMFSPHLPNLYRPLEAFIVCFMVAFL